MATPEKVTDVACGWCFVPPGAQHDHRCPERDDEPDYPAFCGRCGVTYITTCDCDGDDE